MTRVLLGLLAAALLLCGLQTWRADRLKAELVTARSRTAEVTRALQNADTDAQVASNQCAARVAAARLSARAIERIIEREVHVDPQGCAVRSIIGAGELRDALTPIPAAAEPLH